MQKIIFLSLLLTLYNPLICKASTHYPPPKISVIMSTYNRSPAAEKSTLQEAIDSILNQTDADFEFIIINDGSDDKTKELLKTYAQKDKRIRILTNPKNKGLVYSLNRGLDIAQGTYIARMDDDDISLPERFEKQISFLENNPHITATGCAWSFKDTPKNKIFMPKDPDEAKLLTLTQVPVLHPCTMIRNNFIKQHHIRYKSDYLHAEDMPFWWDVIIKHGGQVSNLDDLLLHKSKNSKKVKDYLTVQQESVDRYRQDAVRPFLNQKSPLSVCDVYKKITKIAEFKTLNKTPIHQKMLKKYCMVGGHILLHFKDKKDKKYLVLKGKESYDFITNEKIKILKIAPRYLRLKFSNGDIKSFSLKDSSTFVEIE